MIELTREEAISILKALSKFDGYLFSVKEHGAEMIAEQLDYPIDLLASKLKDE